jgi:hypothetical protein
VNKLIISTLLVLFSAGFIVPSAIAQMEEPNETRTQEYEDLTQTDTDMTSPSEMEGMQEMDPQQESDFETETRSEETLEEAQSSDIDYSGYDVRRTEAFNLVSSAYRGDFEDQGINSYAVLVSNYEDGELTAEDLVNAAVDAGELSPSALEDTSYIEAVDSQLNALTQS